MATILYIEDDPVQSDILKQMLELQGYSVEIAEDGVSGVEKAAIINADLIISDSNMPRLNGLKAIQKIREAHTTADTPIFALSARSDARYQDQALQAGATAVFSKPINFFELLTAIQETLVKI